MLTWWSDLSVLYVSGFGSSLRARDLAYEFERYGRLIRCDIPALKTASSSPFAFVEFRREADAEDAYYDMHGRSIDGRRITVQWAKRPPSSAWRHDGYGNGNGNDRRDRDRDSDRDRRRSPPRRRSPSPRRDRDRDYDRRRSASPQRETRDRVSEKQDRRSASPEAARDQERRDRDPSPVREDREDRDDERERRDE
ncbi:hypothetical protein IAT40_004897 [Kwoniella sp. CBS 6097]